MAYFEGDFWPKAIEENIKELEAEEAEKRQKQMEEGDNGLDFDDFDIESSESVEVSTIILRHFCNRRTSRVARLNRNFLTELLSCGVQQGKKKGKGQKKKGPKTKAPATRKNKSAFTHSGGDLAAKLMAIMEKNREVCLALIQSC
jgi:hypothetical protein